MASVVEQLQKIASTATAAWQRTAALGTLSLVTAGRTDVALRDLKVTEEMATPEYKAFYSQLRSIVQQASAEQKVNQQTSSYQKPASSVVSQTSSSISNSVSSYQSTAQSLVSQTDYKVKAGDTLWAIAKSYGTTVEALLKANPHLNTPQRKYGDLIYAGEIIKIPGSSVQNQASSSQSSAKNKIEKKEEEIKEKAQKCQDDAKKEIERTEVIVLGDMPAWVVEAMYGISHQDLQNQLQMSFGTDYIVKSGTKIEVPKTVLINEQQSKAEGEIEDDALIVLSSCSLKSLSEVTGFPLDELLRLNPHIKDPNEILARGTPIFIGDLKKRFAEDKSLFGKIKNLVTKARWEFAKLLFEIKEIPDANYQKFLDAYSELIKRHSLSVEEVHNAITQALEKYYNDSKKEFNKAQLEFWEKVAEYFGEYEKKLAKAQDIVSTYVLPTVAGALSILSIYLPGLAGPLLTLATQLGMAFLLDRATLMESSRDLDSTLSEFTEEGKKQLEQVKVEVPDIDLIW
ncbi:MAG: LysM domain-containing protein [candidate division WOR-3 bacterium]